ncbi:MAG: bifunctional 5,10-methylenetetrahydrofolate dehydrogenase/5,10-methenyltetrahydrofolate cyclohydrolase [bacterium]
MAKILSGKELAEDVFFALRKKVVKAEKGGERTPGLAVILAGEDEASKLYVRNKKRACYKVGIAFNDYYFTKDAKEAEILETIEFLNNDPSIFGIIAQLPLPYGFDAGKIIRAISPEKDVDGFHPDNIEKFISFIHSDIEKIDEIMSPPVIKAVIALLDQVNESIIGKRAVIISKNEIFAKPLLETVKLKKVDAEIIAPEKIDDKLKKADIIISAVGHPNFLKGEMIKDDVIIIDVGTTLVDGKIVGDADFKSCDKKASYISPVPGGIGPLTVAYLLENVIMDITL